MLGLPAPFVPHSASLSPATAAQVLSTPVPVSAPPTSLDDCLFSISLVSVPLAVRFSVSSGCARRRSVSTYAAILVLPNLTLILQPPSIPNPTFYVGIGTDGTPISCRWYNLLLYFAYCLSFHTIMQVLLEQIFILFVYVPMAWTC